MFNQVIYLTVKYIINYIYSTFSDRHIGQLTFVTNQLFMQFPWKKCLPVHLNTKISFPSDISSVHIAHVVTCEESAIIVGRFLTISGSIPKFE